MRKIDPALLLTFVTVLETGGLKPTSELVNRTISAVSRQLKRLEEILEKELLVRSGRKLVPTKEGKEFLTQAREMLRAHDHMLARTSRPHSDKSDDLSMPNIFEDSQSVFNSNTSQMTTFENKLETPLLKSIFLIWQAYRGDGKGILLDDLLSKGLLSLSEHNVMVTEFDQSHLRVMGASDEPARLFQLDKHGYGITVDQVWRSPKVAESRRKIFSICANVNAPVFYSGNATIPWHSKSYSKTVDCFATTRLDRLLLPVKLNSQSSDRLGVLQIAEFRDRLPTLTRNENVDLSLKEQADNLNFICDVSVAI